MTPVPGRRSLSAVTDFGLHQAVSRTLEAERDQHFVTWLQGTLHALQHHVIAARFQLGDAA
jgi:hypothetical protein